MDIQTVDAGDGKSARSGLEGAEAAVSGRRVLIITNHLTYAIHHRTHLLDRLRREGFAVTIAGTGTQAELEQLTALGLDARHLSVVSYQMNVLADLKLIPAIRTLIIDVQPDILHLFTPKVIACGKLAHSLVSAQKRSVHLVLSLTGLGRLFLPDSPLHHRFVRSRLINLLTWRIQPSSQAVTVETVADRDELTTLAPEIRDQAIVTNGTGIDLEAFRPSERTGPITFLFSGRFLKSKGVETFAAAVERVITQGIDAHFLVAGGFDAQDRDSPPSEIFDALSRSPQVTLLGAVPAKDMYAVLQRTDVVCLPTRYKEGIPRTLLEAAASGCSFIACRTPGWVETVGHAPTSGWFVEPDDVPGLAEVMLQAAGDRDLTRQAGRVARRVIEVAGVSETDVQEHYLRAYRAVAMAD